MRKRRKQCPLLSKYNYPYDFLDGTISDWYKAICLEHCPLVDACIFDYTTRTPAIIKQKLKATIIPCPKCGAKDSWQIPIKEGLSCVHCGNIIYRDEIFSKRHRNEQG